MVLATSMSLIEKKTEEELEQLPCIQYPITFKDQTEALLISGNKVNVMSQAITYQLGLKTWKINVRAQKIDGTTLETNGIIVSTLSILDKDNKERFFEESFLLADVKPDIILEIPFLTIRNADVDFQARELQ